MGLPCKNIPSIFCATLSAHAVYESPTLAFGKSFFIFGSTLEIFSAIFSFIMLPYTKASCIELGIRFISPSFLQSRPGRVLFEKGIPENIATGKKSFSESESEWSQFMKKYLGLPAGDICGLVCKVLCFSKYFTMPAIFFFECPRRVSSADKATLNIFSKGFLV